MRTTPGWRKAFALGLLAAISPTAGCASMDPGAAPGPCAPTLTAATPHSEVQLTVGPEVIDMVLADTPPARDLTSHLPVNVDLQDRMGIASVAELPMALADLAPDVCELAPGDVVYWAESREIAIIHSGAVDGASLLGATRLGTVTDGLEVLKDIVRAPAEFRAPADHS